jgi:hypothetical protein
LQARRSFAGRSRRATLGGTQVLPRDELEPISLDIRDILGARLLCSIEGDICCVEVGESTLVVWPIGPIRAPV